jgi:hypothetical protein
VPAILISTEDAKSSRHYFSAIARSVRRRLLVDIAPSSGSSPLNVLNDAKRHVARSRHGEYRDVWVVFDTEGRDSPRQVSGQVRSSVERARQLGYRTAISNPAFEFWCLLHFEWSTEPFANASRVESRLRQHLQDYVKGGDYDLFRVLRDSTDLAVERAGRLRRERHADVADVCERVPGTEVDLLVSELRPLWD